MTILDGKKTSDTIKEEIAIAVTKRKNAGLKIPHLAAIIVGTDGASMTYVNSKVKSCQKVGFNSTLIDLPEDTTEEQLLHEIEDLNKDKDIDGFIVQLPLPKQIDEQKRRLEKLEREKNELEQKSKQQTVVKQIDSIVAELKLSTKEADALIDTMGKDGVTWEQLLVLPPAAISNAVRGYATPIVLERERQALIKKTQSKDEFQEEKIAEKRQKSVKKGEFSRESLEKEIAAYRKKNFPHLK